MSRQISRAVLFAVRVLGRVGLFPNRLFLVRLSPGKLIEFDEIISMANLKPSDRVLDIGCGNGMQTMLLGKKCREVIGIDTSKMAIQRAETLAHASGLSDRVEFLLEDAVESEFRDKSFTKILSFCVLEHIPDWRRVLKNAFEWLDSNGELVISVDSLATIEDQGIVEKHRKDHFVKTYFDMEALEMALKEAGFSHTELHPMLRSDLAKRLFTRDIANNSFGGRNLPRLLIEYARLRRAEKAASGREKGIIIVAKATR